MAAMHHGHQREVYEVEVWLDPALELHEWTDAVWNLVDDCPNLHLVALGSWMPVNHLQLPGLITDHGVVRLAGDGRPIDIHRQSELLDPGRFEGVWSRAWMLEDGTRLTADVDLVHTIPQETHEWSRQDYAFLKTKIESEYGEMLPQADEAVALEMLDLFLSRKVAEIACAHPAQEVRDRGLRFLLDRAESGDPFAVDTLNYRL